MPRIQAATLAEHREQRTAAIVQAGAELLAEGSVASITEVARRSGLPRSTVYEYFPDAAELVGAVRQERDRAAIANAMRRFDNSPALVDESPQQPALHAYLAALADAARARVKAGAQETAERAALSIALAGVCIAMNEHDKGMGAHDD